MKTRIYTKGDYLARIISSLQRAQPGDRVLLATMDFDVNYKIYDQLLDALTRAAQRSVDVAFVVDAYTFLNSIILTSKARAKRQRNLRWIKALEAAGVHVTICNQPKLPITIPFMGRSHIKCFIINDVVYLGGCNFNNPLALDSMLEFQSKEAADWICAQFKMIAQTGSTQKAFNGQDLACVLPFGGKIIIDAGKRGQSTILDTAYQLIDTAKTNVTMTCQFFPGESTAHHLTQALLHKCHIMLYYSHPAAHGGSAFVQTIYNQLQRLRFPKQLLSGRLKRQAPVLHAKMLCSEQSAMIGSHNYVWQGVKFGTTEIAFVTQSPEIIKQIENSIHELVAPYR